MARMKDFVVPEEAGSDSTKPQSLHELNDLQLGLVGGGSADPIYH